MAAGDAVVRFGILGCADIARKLCRAISLSPNAVLVAVGSRSADKARRFAADNALPAGVRCYGSYEAVLDDAGIDAVYVPLPTSLHARWAALAAEKGKHLLLEKPVAMNAGELDGIIAACEVAGVQFMDATMWMHHPRTAEMKKALSDPLRFGPVKMIHSHFSLCADEDFLENDIRVKPELDGLGSLGDTGWYSIRSILWAVDYELPKTAIAFKSPVYNKAGVLLACGAQLLWEDGKVATFQCSFLSHLTMDLTVVGTRGSLHLNDFVIPFTESSASFSLATDSGFTELVTGWQPLPSQHEVHTNLPQEALMVIEFSRLVISGTPDAKWPTLSRKTQLVIDAVKASLDRDSKPVEIVV